MPDELKIARSYHEALRRIGVQNPGEVSVGVPVALQAPVDDLSHLVAPVEVPIAIAGRTVGAAGAGEFGALEVEARGNGLWIEAAGIFANVDARIGTPATTLLTTTSTVGTPPATFGPAPTAIFRYGTGIATVSLDAARISIGGQTEYLGVYLAPGRIFALAADGANLSFSAWVMWREVPRPQPATE